MRIPDIEIDEEGNIHTLYNEAVDLFALGRLYGVRRASVIEFDEESQEFCVKDVKTKDIVHRNRSRVAAIDTEIELFGPGGPRYSGGSHAA